MYDKYCHILDYNDPQKVISIIEGKIKDNTADITDYKILYTLYIHILEYDLSKQLIDVIANKFNISKNDYFFDIKNFNGNYDILWKVLDKKSFNSRKIYKPVKDLFKLGNVKSLTSLDEPIDNLYIYKQAGIGDQIIFSRWFKDLIPYVKEDIIYIGNGGANLECFLRNFKFLNDFKYNPKKKYHAVSSFSIPLLLNVGSNVSNERYLYCNQELVSTYLPKEKFRIGLCHHGNNLSKLRGVISIPRDDIVEMIGNRAEIVNLYYGEYSYVKGQVNKIARERRNPNIKYLKLDNYEDLLATIETCDVVISCDTSVAHAAGAMGKKTFVLCNGRLYFPWFIEGHVGKSRFYEDVTVVKQFEPASWKISVDKVVNELIEYK